MGRIFAHEDPASELTAEEVAALKRGGFDLTPRSFGKDDPVARTVAEYVALLKTALTSDEAARFLGVEASRVRQRLLGRSLYGVKVGGEWRLPLFQFHDGKSVPGIEQVVESLDESLHPVAVLRWLTQPCPDLETDATGEDVRLSPRDWLLLGLPVEDVVALAREL